MRIPTRVLAALASIVLLAPALQAQTSITYGPMAGVSITTFGGADADLFDPESGLSLNKSSRVGFVGGAFAEIQLHRNFAIEPQVLYVQKGAEYKGTVSDGSTTVDAKAGFKLDYVEIPVLFKGELASDDGGVVPSLFVGPAVGFRVHCSIFAEVPGTGSLDEKCPDNSGIKSTDFSMVFGAGVEFRHFALQGRYDLGLTKIDDAGSDVKNQGWLITLGYAFGGKK